MPEDALAIGLVQAVVAAAITSWLGLVLGEAMKKVRR
jgi:hypothetical protein